MKSYHEAIEFCKRNVLSLEDIEMVCLLLTWMYDKGYEQVYYDMFFMDNF